MANFPGATNFGRYEVRHKEKPEPRIAGPSKVYLPHQPAATLSAASTIWRATTEKQREFLEEFSVLNCDHKLLPELKVRVSDKPDEISSFLGVDVPSNISQANLMAASSLNISLNWKREGYRKIIYRDDEGLWQGFSVRDRSFYQVSRYDFEDVVKLETNSDDEIFIQRWLSSPGKNLIPHVMKTIAKMKKIDLDNPRELDGKKVYYDRMRVPNVRLDRTFTDTPLKDMWFEKDGVKHEVDGFINKVKLDMDWEGVKVKSYSCYGLPGVYCNIDTSKPRPIEFKVDKPFLMWVHRKRMKYPYFIGHITEQDWEKIDW